MTVYGPGWDWNRPDYYEPSYVTSYIPAPYWNDAPLWPVITIEGPTLEIPRPGCSQVPTTISSVITTEVTYTSTITEAPEDGPITVYIDEHGDPYTYGANTVYEIYVYTTTQEVEEIGLGFDCGLFKDKRSVAECNEKAKRGIVKQKRARGARMPRTVEARGYPAYVEAKATPVA